MKNMIAIFMLMLFASGAMAQGLWFSGGSGGGGSGKPGMAMTDDIFVATGVQMNIYTNNLNTLPVPAISTNVDNPGALTYGVEPYIFSFWSMAGSVRNRSYRWTPAAAGDSLLVISAYDHGGKKVETATTTLRGIPKTNGSGSKNILFIGDSTFDDGGPTVIKAIDDKFLADGGGQILPIGTQVDNGVYHESSGGKGWEWYAENAASPFLRLALFAKRRFLSTQ